MKTPHFLALFFIITLAVTCGNLLSNYIAAQFAASELREVNAIIDLTREQLIEQKQADAAVRQNTAKKQRARSEKGKAMWRSCIDWSAMHQKKQTYTTEKESKRQCAIYHHYVESGL
ncbi:hypothetical protein [Neptunomonas japonica]|uniref:hypothetical protein n=1 Tax=Neptunomonas japonica TaxID=417574 RepID=UPI0003FEB172|nr:hypothetical protein [Neptunomonas japonica]